MPNYQKFQEEILYPVNENGISLPNSEPIGRMMFEFDGKAQDILPRLIERLQEFLEFAKRENW